MQEARTEYGRKYAVWYAHQQAYASQPQQQAPALGSPGAPPGGGGAPGGTFGGAPGGWLGAGRPTVMQEPEQDPVVRVLTTKHYFDVLQLPVPTWDAIGRASWPHTEMVGAAFRRLSFALHPDRASHEDAPRAFEILKRARSTLADAVEREKYVNRYVEDQRSLPQNSSWGGQGSASDRIRAQVANDAEKKELRKDEARDRQNQIHEQARRRKQLAEQHLEQTKAQAAAALKRRRQEEEEEDNEPRQAAYSWSAVAAPKAKPPAGAPNKPFRKAFL